MSIETLAKQGIIREQRGLAGIDIMKLKQMRNAQMINCFKHFGEDHFRMEYVAKIRETEFINDASARNVNATWYTLQTTTGPVVWIAMYDGKDTNYTILQQVASQKVRELICVGDQCQQLQEAFADVIPVIDTAFTIEEAVHKAFYNKQEVSRVIFSPACNMGTLNEEYGTRYNKEINEL